jgi:hypothetical protein
MQNFETSATVENEGHLHVEGVPFPPGTRVEVTISPQERPKVENADAWQRLSEALDQAHNTAPIGPLRRDELYDRDVR